MSKDIVSFYYYVNNRNTDLTNKYRNILGDTINKLPNKICSSKIIYNILKEYINSDYKHKIFKDTFMEYFKYKLHRLH